MNWEQIKGNWMEFRGSAKQRWADLTDDDLAKIDGKRDELAGRIVKRYGVALEDAERQIDAWLKRI